MRQRAAESDIVIVNHHLLCADAAVRQSNFGEVIPRCSNAIVDEAHQLEDVATQYFGLSVSSYRVDDLARDVDRALGARLVTDGERREQIADDVRRIRDDARRFFSALQMLRFDDAGGARRRDARARRSVATSRRSATTARRSARRSRRSRRTSRWRRTCRKTCWRSAAAPPRSRDDLRFLLRADDAGYVYFLETRGRGVFLSASPIDVSATIRDLLLDRMDATVLTSATLTVDGSFDYVKGRLGVGRATELQARLGVRLRAPGDPLSAAGACPIRGSRSSPRPRRARSSRS